MPPKAKEVDPEVLMRRKFRAKCLFRALFRLVLANAYWLIESVDNYEGLEDVKRRVAQAVRGKTKAKKQLLNVQDKSLLNQPAENRTDQQKQYLYKILGGLKCFKRYPNHVKKKLAALTYFKYYGPGRTIVRQHQEAHAMYFVVTGDLIISQMIWDELLQQHVSVEIGVMRSGDMFGEVSLLHNIPRTATVTSTGHVELLALMKEDFKNVLQASVQKQWEEIRRAMSVFTYFDGLDEVACREGCIVAKMKFYEANETLLGDGVGVANFVYFLLSGRCQMIETLQVHVTTRLGKDFFTLYDPYIPKVESEADLDTKYFKAYQNKKGFRDSEEYSESQMAVSSSRRAMSKDKRRVSIFPDSKIGPLVISNDTSVIKTPVTIASESSQQVLLHPREEKRVSILQVTEPATSSKNQRKLRTYFMQVCQFNPGSTFGFGENMRDRRIVALTPVQCMLMPKVWLLQRNTANIWTRVQYYLEKKIPTKKQVFKEFLANRQWMEYKNLLVADVVARSNTVNSTTVHDVPYAIRMEEMLDI